MDNEDDSDWAFVDDGKGGYGIAFQTEELPEFLKPLGYVQVPKSHIIPLLAEQAHQLGLITQSCVTAERFIVYRHFTDLGWIIRDGATYGVDYLLYSGPPGQVHSQYAVLIGNGQVLKWRHFAGIARTVYNAKKELLVVRTDGQVIQSIHKVDRFLPEMLNKK